VVIAISHLASLGLAPGALLFAGFAGQWLAPSSRGADAEARRGVPFDERTPMRLAGDDDDLHKPPDEGRLL
jgi:hypothetical protein